MDKKIMFSVIIPVYNVESYLNECVNSVLSQDLADFEIILVNDGSTDNSGAICDEFSKNENRVRVIHQENKGQISARCVAISIAIGKYCLFLDSDDYWDFDLLSKLQQLISKTAADMIIFNYRRVRDDKSIILEPPVAFKNERLFDLGDKWIIIDKIIDSFHLNNIFCKVVKRELLDVNECMHYRDIKFGEDLLQTLQLIHKANNIFYSPQRYYNYRINPTSITQNIHISHLTDNCFVRESVLNYMTLYCLTERRHLVRFYSFFMSNTVSFLIKYMNSVDTDLAYMNLIRDLARQKLFLEGCSMFWSLKIPFFKKLAVVFVIVKNQYLLVNYIKLINKYIE